MVLLLIMDFLNLLCQKTLPRNIILFQKTLGNHISDRSIRSYYWNMGSSTFTFVWGEQEPLESPPRVGAVCKDRYTAHQSAKSSGIRHPDTDDSMCQKLE